MKNNVCPLVTIIIVNYNGKNDTVELIESLKKIKYTNYKIFLVDNNSTDGSIKILKAISKKNKKIKLFLSKKNLGLVGGSNKGIEYAIKNDSDYVLFMNNDMYVKEDFLNILVNTIEQDNSIAAVGPSILYSKEEEIIWSGEIKFHTYGFRSISEGKNIREVSMAPRKVDALDCAFLAKIDVIKKIGPLFSDFFTMHEFTGWCLNARKFGYNIVYAPNSLIWHKVSRTIKSMGKLCTYADSRNWITVLKRTQKPVIYFLGLFLHLIFLIPRYLRSFFIERKFYIKEYIEGIIDHFTGKNKYIKN